MRRACLALLVTWFALRAYAADTRAPAIAVREIASPARADSVGAALAAGPDGTVWMSWVEPAAPAKAGGAPAAPTSRAPASLRVAAFDAATQSWAAARIIVANETVSPNSADFPQLAIDGAGVLHAWWTDGEGGAFHSQSGDRGESWSAPRRWVTHRGGVEMLAAARLADGRVLVTWLDGRARQQSDGAQQLFARVAGDAEANELRVAARVCDCCQTTLAPFLDGGALVGFRGRSANEIRDVQTARFRDGRWEESRPLNGDGWQIAACPVNGPRLTSDGSRVGAAWFTAAEGTPRVLVSFSPDAGVRWLAPLRVDMGHPAGHVEAVLLRDSALLVSWLESDGSLWLRRVSPEFAATEPLPLAGAGTANPRGFPRAICVRDYAGEHTDATILVSYTGAGTPAGVRTLLVWVPEGDLVTAERNCDCAPTLAQLEGVAVRGTFLTADAATQRVRVRLQDVPGVFAAGEREFHVPPPALAGLEPGRDFLGRVNRAGDEWLLTEIRLLDAPVHHRN